MASDHSMDISVDFDFQELKNAVDQALREATNRFDLKDSGVEISLTEDMVKITAAADIQVESVFGILTKKMIGRNLSSKIFKRGEIKEIGGMKVKQEIEIIKSLDQENAKKISAYIRENFPKCKPNIQGDTVRVSSKSIDDLQGIKAGLAVEEAIKVPLSFGNFK